MDDHDKVLEDDLQEPPATRETWNADSDVHESPPIHPDERKEYVIFPKDGKTEDALKRTEDHIKYITETKDPIYSYRDRIAALFHWIVNATDAQQILISEDDGVEGVEENIMDYEPHSLESSPRARHSPGPIAQQHEKKEFVVFPKDGKNVAALEKTEQYLKVITETTELYSYRNRFGSLTHWLVEATDSQLKFIVEDEGISSVEENIEVLLPDEAL